MCVKGCLRRLLLLVGVEERRGGDKIKFLSKLMLPQSLIREGFLVPWFRCSGS